MPSIVGWCLCYGRLLYTASVIVLAPGAVVGPVYMDVGSSVEVRTMVHKGVIFASILFSD
jgi:hypothetical protein